MASEEQGRDPVADALRERAERLRQDAMDEFGVAPILDPVPVTPPPWHDYHEHPEPVEGQLTRWRASRAVSSTTAGRWWCRRVD